MADNTFYGTSSYVVRLMFDVYAQKDNSFLGTETLFLGKGEIVPEVYDAWMFPSESKAVTTFQACYRNLISNFIKEIYNAKVLVRQWDGFAHIDSIYIRPGRIEQLDPTEVNEVGEERISFSTTKTKPLPTKTLYKD